MTEVTAAATVAPTPRRAATRDRLMAAARTVFAERGIIGASVEEICETAGFTRGAFYSNFADKDALVLELLRGSIAAAYAAAEDAVSAALEAPEDLTPAELVAFALARLAQADDTDRDTVLTQQELLLYAARQPALRAPYLEFAEASQARLRGLLEDALRVSHLEFTLDFSDALELLGAAYDHVHLQALFTGRSDSTLLQTLVLAITRPTT